MPRTYLQGSIPVIVLDERLTRDEVAAAQELVQGTTKQRMPQLILDLRQVRLIDSAGLELLAEAHAQCVQRGGMLRLASPGALIHDVLRVTGMGEDFSISEDVIAAAGEFAQ